LQSWRRKGFWATRICQRARERHLRMPRLIW
jgi:hypothetical protein